MLWFHHLFRSFLFACVEKMICKVNFTILLRLEDSQAVVKFWNESRRDFFWLLIAHHWRNIEQHYLLNSNTLLKNFLPLFNDCKNGQWNTDSQIQLSYRFYLHTRTWFLGEHGVQPKESFAYRKERSKCISAINFSISCTSVFPSSALLASQAVP